ncbi:MAG: glycosyltransferase [Deferribacteres bacterium]|nr:glycosyltransferase [Deferribacteres bacterium]
MAETTTKTDQDATKRQSNNKPAATRKTASRARASKKSQVKPAVTAIVPIFNMGASVEPMYDDLIAGLNAYGQPYEVIFIDDASTDDTWAKLDQIAERDKKVKLIRMRSSFGEASSFDAGLSQSTGARILYATARVRANLRQVDQLLQKLDEGYDLVCGWRKPRKDSDLNQKVSKLFNRIVRRFAHLDLHDINSGIFATERSVMEDLRIYGNMNIFIPILANRKGFKVAEVQIEQLPGQFRQSKYLPEYIQRLLDIITVIFLTNYSKKPLHFLGFFGMIFTLTGGLMNAYLFLTRMFGSPIAGRPLLLLGALLLVIGLQMISIGLIGEMIIYTHAREIKEYNIEKVVGA